MIMRMGAIATLDLEVEWGRKSDQLCRYLRDVLAPFIVLHLKDPFVNRAAAQ